MITHVRGRLVHKAPTQAVVEVGGVGFGLSISLATYEQLPEPGAEVQLWTRLYVREEGVELFGFAAPEEREMFQLLLGVAGVGPRLAQTILSGMSVTSLQEAILGERLGELTAIKGIGRKTGERLVVELRDKVGALGPRAALAGAGAPSAPGRAAIEEAVLALVALGEGAAAARQAVHRAAQKQGPEASVQQLIKQALQDR
jgi:Holliday junction DNA helicase RuvA